MAEDKNTEVCGIVMPISAIDNCSEAHWAEVKSIISDAAVQAGFDPVLVSDADEIGIIQKRIIENLYDNPVVVCDVSAKNPNVMFELGMRLAFDKPTIIIKDDATSYSFDTSSIEHLEYPRDLRFGKILDFKVKLSAKIRATHQASIKDENYTTFLKHFGEFKVAKIDKKEVLPGEYIIEELKSIRRSISKLEGLGGGADMTYKLPSSHVLPSVDSMGRIMRTMDYICDVDSFAEAKILVDVFNGHPGVSTNRVSKKNNGARVEFKLRNDEAGRKAAAEISEFIEASKGLRKD